MWPTSFRLHMLMKNVFNESGVARASKLKCNSYGKKGAVLGCYMKSYQKTYHVHITFMNADGMRFQNTTDAVAAQFFLKNVHVEMRKAASELFGHPENTHRPNVFGELMRILISIVCRPSESCTLK